MHSSFLVLSSKAGLQQESDQHHRCDGKHILLHLTHGAYVIYLQRTTVQKPCSNPSDLTYRAASETGSILNGVLVPGIFSSAELDGGGVACDASDNRGRCFLQASLFCGER